ncbi:TIGR03088 family PEP-CTERM/XrtA system glycosyltransferase [Alkalilimnicola ehrlichii MLHE-1]|uniref:Glycosyl transferase, group 1 n=1 Tax=Alkalilimnicola ehrlichii (strain ATCC BAA-1101 / DSM 17681 / MLHE-1) TaxID=187272 RepID=Q0ACE3_ALKEH|nr:TIGR03088 family PEP-CTERM/XrtA system glycosyltransferase [Alkalilimnicola ehrlichii]ABI55494.1 glycosyl transferase, group 1 [Alkalilimnicola ehrlichii MLHE-1]
MSAARPLATAAPGDERPLVAHIIHRLDVGGMENGLVNLINHMPAERYRHAIVCMTRYTDFSQRIHRDDVSLHALHKREGKDLGVHRRLHRLLRSLRPAIVHTRNLATLEAQATAAAAGVRARIHGEHGWDIGDLDGARTKHRLMRRLARPLVGRYIALSRQQLDYLAGAIGVPEGRLHHVCNGVDTHRFRPRRRDEASPLPDGFAPEGSLVVGSVMRMQAVKAPEDLVDAFIALRERAPARFPRLRLVLVGDGPLSERVARRLAEAGVADQAWLPGARDDVAAVMRALDLFVLPSLAEGICNTVLEAMACGLPVVATEVGGNPDLVRPGETGTLVPAGDPSTLARHLQAYLDDPERRQREGEAARARAEAVFSMEAMVEGYMRVYDQALAEHPLPAVPGRRG